MMYGTLYGGVENSLFMSEFMPQWKGDTYSSHCGTVAGMGCGVCTGGIPTRCLRRPPPTHTQEDGNGRRRGEEAREEVEDSEDAHGDRHRDLLRAGGTGSSSSTGSSSARCRCVCAAAAAEPASQRGTRGCAGATQRQGRPWRASAPRRSSSRRRGASLRTRSESHDGGSGRQVGVHRSARDLRQHAPDAK